MSNINDFFHFTHFWDFVWAHFCIRKNRAFRRSASYALHSRWFSPKSFCPASKVFLTIKKTLALAPRERLRRGYNPLRVFFTQIAWQLPPIPAVTPNLIRDLYKLAPILRLCILHIFLYLHTLQKVSATYREYNVAKQCAEALECRLKTRQKSICAVRA